MIGHEMIGEWTNHLWQSTLFAVVAALVTLAFRKNRAQVRYWVWLSASVKFLVPFALLMNLGNSLWSAFAAKKIATELAPPAVSLTVQQIAQPFTDSLAFAPSRPAHAYRRLDSNRDFQRVDLRISGRGACLDFAAGCAFGLPCARAHPLTSRPQSLFDHRRDCLSPAWSGSCARSCSCLRAF